MSQFPDDDNGAMLQCLTEHRFDFSIEHPVDFFAVLPTQTSAEAIAESYRQRQSEDPAITDVELRDAADGNSKEVVITRVMMVEYLAVRDFEAELNRACRQHKGDSDGWGVLQEDEDGEDESSSH